VKCGAHRNLGRLTTLKRILPAEPLTIRTSYSTHYSHFLTFSQAFLVPGTGLLEKREHQTFPCNPASLGN
jgi:hypothetical protein